MKGVKLSTNMEQYAYTKEKSVEEAQSQANLFDEIMKELKNVLQELNPHNETVRHS